MSTTSLWFFYFGRAFMARLFLSKGWLMNLQLIKNPDEKKAIVYKISRVIYAETKASSLLVVEALASMINNLHVSSGKNYEEIIQDENIFESLLEDSNCHSLLKVDCNNRGFQMCVRVVQRMLKNDLEDKCNGAVRFHRYDSLPDWSLDKGYIADIDGLLFYL